MKLFKQHVYDMFSHLFVFISSAHLIFHQVVSHKFLGYWEIKTQTHVSTCLAAPYILFSLKKHARYILQIIHVITKNKQTGHSCEPPEHNQRCWAHVAAAHIAINIATEVLSKPPSLLQGEHDEMSTSMKDWYNLQYPERIQEGVVVYVL